MNDPWDVKSVTQSGQYVSCMKINGVPLLPPILSRECRKEMQYYKLLAKEIEKRITHLKTYVAVTDTDSNEDSTDAPELPECEQNYELPIEESCEVSTVNRNSLEKAGDINLKPEIETKKNVNKVIDSSKFVIDLSVSINENGVNTTENIPQNRQLHQPAIELPERDCDCPLEQTQDKTVKTRHYESEKEKCVIEQIVNFRVSVSKGVANIPDLTEMPLSQDGPSSLVSSKSFTGSLNDLHSECVKESHRLIRQSSYTVLNPSPQLMAHLEVQSLSTGVDLNSISMSESLSNIDQNRKRRNWDLETAKEKWSSMAIELYPKKVLDNSKNNGNTKSLVTKLPKKIHQSPKKDWDLQTAKEKLSNMAIELDQKKFTEKEKNHNSIKKIETKITKTADPISPSWQSPTSAKPKSNGASTKSDSNPEIKRLSYPSKKISSDLRRSKEPSSPKHVIPKEPAISTDFPESMCKSEDPAFHIRELYERLQKQQMKHMANLMDKQKREQMMLQQVFEEQNNLLYTQLKTICPETSIEVKQAWASDTNKSVDHGPVSLSQLINQKPPEQSVYDDSVSATLTDTNKYISHCDDVLKKSRNITGSLKKQHLKSQSPNSDKIHTAKHHETSEVNKTRTGSPNNKSAASRKLQYDTSLSSERDYEPILTDRTNDTLADLNVTLSSDLSYCESYKHNNTVLQQFCGNQSPLMRCAVMSRSTDSRTNYIESKTLGNVCMSSKRPSILNCQPTSQQLAAATKIVAYAKGYLVRRLMRTERVQTIVQTIRDALLCALQLHQEREGIRGADVDLHRRLIQQITAACYTLHDTFVAASAAERCAVIAADRRRRAAAAAQRQTAAKTHRPTDIMSQSHSGAFPARPRRQASPSLMTQSSYGNTAPL